MNIVSGFAKILHSSKGWTLHTFCRMLLYLGYETRIGLTQFYISIYNKHNTKIL